jgi:hypothetical protein
MVSFLFYYNQENKKHFMRGVKRKVIYFMLLVALHSYSQSNYYGEYLAQKNRTYWAETNSIRIPAWGCIQRGMFFDIDGSFDQYCVKEENDTTFISPEIDFLGYFCTKYFIHGDTIFISDWFIEEADTATLQRPTAYKILYATKQRMLILPLEKDNQGNWRDSELSYPRCNILNVIEFKKVK